MSAMHDKDPIEPEENGTLHSLNRFLWTVAWIGLGLLSIFFLVWAITYLLPNQRAVSQANPGENRSVPTILNSPTVLMDESSDITLEPLLKSESTGQGLWSPDRNYFFIPLGDIPAPGGDRRTISLHFISTASGEDCPASETFLGQHGFQNYAWLDNERVLYIDNQGRAFLFTACKEGGQDLSDQFNEPLVRVAMPLIPPEHSIPGSLLLESTSAYWLLDPVSLQARALTGLVPSPEMGDSFVQLPNERQMAILQPITDKPDFSRLVLLNLENGELSRDFEIQVQNEGRAPLSEWVGAQRLFVWSYEPAGPLLVDLSQEPPQLVRVIPELFGIDMVYPDELASMGVFYNSEEDTYHIVFNANFPEDKSIYLYHSESGQVEQLDGNRQVMMVFPDDQRMPLVPLQDEPVEDGDYDVIWVDVQDRSQVHVQASGHLPRNYYMLQSRLLPGGTSMLFGSSQGISLVDLLNGETRVFWRLSGAEDALLPTLWLSPDGRVLIAKADSMDGELQNSRLYRLVLDE